MIATERLKGIPAFVQAAEAGSFTLAGERLGLTKSAVAKSIQRLEERLGTRLFHRTTRSLSLTDDGAAFHATCARVLAELETAEAVLAERGRAPRGRLRVDLPVSFGRLHALPVLLELTGEHPGLDLDVSFSDRFVDLVDEGIDLAIRLGDLEDSRLIARRLASQRLVVCAAPGYLERHGAPRHPDEIAGHACIVFNNAGRPNPWRFVGRDGPFAVTVRGRVLATNGEAMRDTALAGHGLTQLPTFLVGRDLEAGTLVAVLPGQAGEGPPVHAIYPQARHLSPKVRVAVDRLAATFSPVPPWDASMHLVAS